MPMMSRRQLEEIGKVVCGIPVWGCLPGSTAAEAGVRYGDIVLSVNGMATPTIVEYLQARKLRQDGFVLCLFRSGTEITMYVPFRAPSDPMAALAAQIADGRYAVAMEEGLAEPTSLPS